VERRAFRVDPRLLELAREMRREAAPAEGLLWACLRNRQLGGFKFRRQHPIDRYIADFCCTERKIIVEADGDSHQDRCDRDEQRTAHLEKYCFRVIRFENTDVFENLEQVLLKILEACEGAARPAPHPASPPSTGERSEQLRSP
jgi:very-short-patch-repair endonuclease